MIYIISVLKIDLFISVLYAVVKWDLNSEKLIVAPSKTRRYWNETQSL